MDRESLVNTLKEHGLEDTIFFENPGYFNAIVGISSDDRLIYDFDKMVDCLVEEDGMSVEDAIDFINYNTLRAMPYYPNGPIVLMPLIEA